MNTLLEFLIVEICWIDVRFKSRHDDCGFVVLFEMYTEWINAIVGTLVNISSSVIKNDERKKEERKRKKRSMMRLGRFFFFPALLSRTFKREN